MESHRVTLLPGQSVLVLDPGESTGWVSATILPNKSYSLTGGTAGKNHCEIAALFSHLLPSVVVFERFNLYPGMAKTLSWNSFYPCEVIGVIRYLALKDQLPVFEQAPNIKKFAGGLQQDWKELRKSTQVTEHTKDAYLHWKYFLRNSALIV